MNKRALKNEMQIDKNMGKYVHPLERKKYKLKY